MQLRARALFGINFTRIPHLGCCVPPVISKELDGAINIEFLEKNVSFQILLVISNAIMSPAVKHHRLASHHFNGHVLLEL